MKQEQRAGLEPFIGLLGTVVGIMDAFMQIGIKGTAGLAVVAPGIAEALRASGLAAITAMAPEAFARNFIDKYDADVIIMDNRTSAIQPADLDKSKPTWKRLPAVKAGQVIPRVTEPVYSYENAIRESVWVDTGLDGDSDGSSILINRP